MNTYMYLCIYTHIYICVRTYIHTFNKWMPIKINASGVNIVTTYWHCYYYY